MSINMNAENQTEDEDDFTLGDDDFTLGDDDDFTLGDESEDDSDDVDSADTSSDEVEENTSTPTNKSIYNVDYVYDKIIKPYVEMNARNYIDFLKQRYIEVPVLYKIMGLKPLQEPTAEDKERIKEICDAWSAEGVSKFQRTDLPKSEVITECTGALKGVFTTGQERAFREGRLSLAWNEIDSLIDDKCDDAIVELNEMVDIVNRGQKLGLFYDIETRTEFNKTVVEKIKNHNAKIETSDDWFINKFQELKENNPNIVIDTPANRSMLAKYYCRIKNAENVINGINEKFTEEAAGKDLDNFLEKNDIFLKSKEQYFEDEYYNGFKEKYKVSKLPDDKYYMLKTKATDKYGFTEEEWEAFEKKRKIKHENAAQQYEDKTQLLEKQLADKDKKIKNAKKNGIIRNFAIIVGVIVLLVAGVVVFKIVRPIEYASVVDSITGFFNPSEEQKAQIAADKAAKAALKNAKEQAKLDAKTQKAKAKEEERQMKLKEREQELAKNRVHEPQTLVVSKKEGSKYQTVQAAINAAVDTDIVVIEPGIYTETFSVRKNITITSGDEVESNINSKYFSSDKVPLFVLKDSESCTVAGEAKVSGLVFTNASDLKFSNFKNFYENSSYASTRFREIYYRDGTIRNDIITDIANPKFATLVKISGNAKISNCVFTNMNQYGVTIVSDSPVVENSIFNNTSIASILAVGKSNGSVAGSFVNNVMMRGFVAIDNAILTVNNCELSQGKKVDAITYGILPYNDAKINITDSTILGFATNAYAADNTSLVFENCKIIESQTYGVSLADKASLQLKNCEIANNEVGGVAVFANSSANITGTSIHDNNSVDCYAGEASTLTFDGCELYNSENIIMASDTATLNVNNSKVANYLRGLVTVGSAVLNAKGTIITEGTNGIYVAGTTRAYLENCEVTHNEECGFINEAETTIEATFKGCKFNDNGHSGISIFKDSKVVLDNTECSNNYNYGIALNEYATGVITNSNFNNNSGTGIYIHNHGVGTVSGSTASGNKNGAFFEGSGSAKMEKCNFTKNINGYVMIDNAVTELSECKIIENTGEGLFMSDNTNGTFFKCTVKKNKENNFTLSTKNKPVFEKLKTTFWEKFEMWLDS